MEINFHGCCVSFVPDMYFAVFILACLSVHVPDVSPFLFGLLFVGPCLDIQTFHQEKGTVASTVVAKMKEQQSQDESVSGGEE